MGWQDAPVVDGPSASKAAWMSAPLAEEKNHGRTIAQGIGQALIKTGQGAAFGLMDEIGAGLGAAPALLTDQNFGVEYDRRLGNIREKQAEYIQDHPNVSLAAEIGGMLGSGIVGTGTKAGAAVANTLRSGSRGAKVVKGALAGATSGGLYGFGTGEGEQRLESAGEGATIGGAVGGAAPLVGAALSRLNTKTTLPKANEIKQVSQKLYESARQKGAKFTQGATNELWAAVDKQLPQDEFSKIAIGDNPLSQFAKRLDGVSHQKMTLESFENLDKYLGAEGQKAFKSGDNDLARRFGEIQGKFREVVTNDKFIRGSREAIHEHRKATDLWRSFAKMRDVEEILQNAQYYAGGEAAGIKAGFASLAKSPSKLRGYKPNEVKAIQRAAKTGMTEGLLRTMGSRLMTIGGFASGGVPGALIGHAASSISRGGAAMLKGADATRVGKMIAKNAGIATEKQRIPVDKLAEIMGLPPAQAKQLLTKTPKKGK